MMKTNLDSSTTVTFSQPSGGSLTNGHDLSSFGLSIVEVVSGDVSTSPINHGGKQIVTKFNIKPATIFCENLQ